jgi:hypothetical protein
MAETSEAAKAAFDHFVETYGAKHNKGVACLVKDRRALLSLYRFPAEHWKARSAPESPNRVESIFATVRRPTTETRKTALTGFPALGERSTALASSGRAKPLGRRRSRRPLYLPRLCKTLGL